MKFQQIIFCMANKPFAVFYLTSIGMATIAMNVQAGAVLIIPLGMFCFPQKVLVCYRRGRLLTMNELIKHSNEN